MSDEPDDGKLRQYADACFASCYPPVDAVVQAILAERERAAHLVETWAQDHLTVQPSFTRMAAAIRRGSYMPDLDDETNYILFKALWAELQSNSVSVAMSDVTTIAYGVRSRLAEMGMEICPSTSVLLEKGREEVPEGKAR